MVLAAYLDCAFRCAESAECRDTELADDFLCLCVSKALEIDVEIKWEDLQQGFDDDETSEEEEDEEEDSEMFGEENGDDRDTDSRENDEEDIFELDEFNVMIDDANINNGKASKTITGIGVRRNRIITTVGIATITTSTIWKRMKSAHAFRRDDVPRPRIFAKTHRECESNHRSSSNWR